MLLLLLLLRWWWWQMLRGERVEGKRGREER
jgi:hypothetical protein